MRVTVLCCLLIAAIEARYQEVVSGNDQDVCKKKNGETRLLDSFEQKKSEDTEYYFQTTWSSELQEG